MTADLNSFLRRETALMQDWIRRSERFLELDGNLSAGIGDLEAIRAEMASLQTEMDALKTRFDAGLRMLMGDGEGHS